jgi:DNA-binding IclR family transcriptional regulator
MAGSQSLERGLEVLEILDQSPGPLGVREMSRRLGLSPTIVQRLVNTLAEYGYIRQETDMKKYVIGYRAFGLGWRLTHDDRLISASIGILQELSSRHLLNSYLGVRRNDKALYLLTLQSEGPVAIRGMPGGTAHLHSTAMGKVLLAHLPVEEARRLLTAAPLAAVTERTITDPEALLDELGEVRQNGFAMVRGENIPGVQSIGAPLRDMSGAVVASISVAYPDNFFKPSFEVEAVRLTVEAARAISKLLGHRSEPTARQA